MCTQYDCFNSRRASRVGGEKKDKKKKKKHTTQPGKAECVVPVWVCFRWFFSFYFNSRKRGRQRSPQQKCDVWTAERERAVVPLFCLFVLKTGLAAESTSLSEYKRCLRGNISEVLCWWLTVWQTSGVKLQLHSRRGAGGRRREGRGEKKWNK